MKITDVWNLTREAFIVQIEGSITDLEVLQSALKAEFPDKHFFVHRIERGSDK